MNWNEWIRIVVCFWQYHVKTLEGLLCISSLYSFYLFVLLLR